MNTRSPDAIGFVLQSMATPSISPTPWSLRSLATLPCTSRYAPRFRGARRAVEYRGRFALCPVVGHANRPFRTAHGNARARRAAARLLWFQPRHNAQCRRSRLLGIAGPGGLQTRVAATLPYAPAAGRISSKVVGVRLIRRTRAPSASASAWAIRRPNPC